MGKLTNWHIMGWNFAKFCNNLKRVNKLARTILYVKVKLFSLLIVFYGKRREFDQNWQKSFYNIVQWGKYRDRTPENEWF